MHVWTSSERVTEPPRTLPIEAVLLKLGESKQRASAASSAHPARGFSLSDDGDRTTPDAAFHEAVQHFAAQSALRLHFLSDS